jgi:hypothetical protein
MTLTPLQAFAALRPHLEWERRTSLDWAPHLLSQRAHRRAVEESFEYHGANLPLGTPPEELAGAYRVTTREAKGSA